ncbi:restriction endonuclease subunit S [Vibrio splendidus]|uniref:restriction endonuclease subunit S n=1 Tax=Vibrio splendidus TaxID=29497 RepID=UPI000C85DF09|nr:restriction endonuclease subunit S [Vibrio splendidus]PMI30625.1 hypothetical protein BCU48_09155 [Vibrio splendidus]
MEWEVKKLSEVCDSIFAGGDVPKDRLSKFKTNKFNIPIFANGEKNKGLYGYTDKARVNTPSMTVSARGTIGYSEIRYEPFLPVVRLIVLTPNSDKVVLEFLKYVLRGMEFVNSGTSIPQLTVPMIKNYECSLPPIPEQKRIVALLDTVFADLEQARTKTEQNLKNARELFDSYLQQVFSQKGEGWVESKLGSLLHISSSKRVYAKDWTDSGVPFFGGKEIVKLAKYGKAVSNAFISEEKYMEYASKYDMPQEGDILMTARGTIGVGYIVKEGDKFYYKDGNIISLRQKSPTNPDFILYAFKSHKIIDQIKELTGTTVSHLPLNKAKEIIINIPNYQVQNELVLQIKKVECNIQQVISIYEEKLTSIDELKKSILQKAFRGELTHK